MKFINSLFKMFQEQKFENRHLQKPHLASGEDDDAFMKAARNEIMSSSYYQHNQLLKEKVFGKVVSNSVAGKSGFALFFSDGSWVASYIHEMKLIWKSGSGDLHKDLETLMNSPEYGNGYDPLPINRPYANQVCDIKTEIANSHGKEITAISSGKNTFNFCFPNGMELDTHIAPTSDGRLALRVFWEQW